jgi:hypothetical protein
LTSNAKKEYGIVILLDALGTHQRILDDINQFLADWDSVLSRLDENIKILEQYLSRDGYKTGIKQKISLITFKFFSLLMTLILNISISQGIPQFGGLFNTLQIY